MHFPDFQSNVLQTKFAIILGPNGITAVNVDQRLNITELWLLQENPVIASQWQY